MIHDRNTDLAYAPISEPFVFPTTVKIADFFTWCDSVLLSYFIYFLISLGVIDGWYTNVFCR